jgi:hypothetical protein
MNVRICLLISPRYLSRVFGETLCAQRLILGCKEYATHINFIDGRVVSELTVEYVFATAQSIKVKDRALQRYVRCPDLTALVTILRALNYEGLCCFNYKRSWPRGIRAKPALRLEFVRVILRVCRRNFGFEEQSCSRSAS